MRLGFTSRLLAIPLSALLLEFYSTHVQAQDPPPPEPAATPATPPAAPTTPATPAAAQPVAPAPQPAAATPPPAAPANPPPAVPADPPPAQETATVPVVSELEPEGTAPEPDETPDDGPSLNVGMGIRTGIGIDPDSASASITDGFMAPGSLGGNEALVRPYFSGQLNEYLGFTGNFEAYAKNTSTGVPIRILDAIVQLHLHDLFNVWVGQFLPPQDRSALDGPYYMNAWNYPIQVAGFPFEVAARDRGFALWGQVGGGKFKYQVGAFDLQSGVHFKNSRFSGRLVLNLLDPEPGYYNSSTYYGEKDVLAIAVSGMAQPAQIKVAGNAVDAALYGFQSDILFEKNLHASGVVTLEGSFWYFKEDAGYVLNPGGLAQGVGVDATYGSGSSFFVLASYLLPNELGIGKLQPGVRLQFRKPDAATDPTLAFDGTLGYIIDGHNNKLYLGYQRVDPLAPGSMSFNALYLGSQIQM